jgi:hypothetical protein
MQDLQSVKVMTKGLCRADQLARTSIPIINPFSTMMEMRWLMEFVPCRSPLVEPPDHGLSRGLVLARHAAARVPPPSRPERRGLPAQLPDEGVDVVGWTAFSGGGRVGSPERGKVYGKGW